MADLLAILLTPPRLLVKLVVLIVQLLIGLWFMYVAWDIRMYSIRDFGYIIHEFDPWFNYRATEYLAENGLERFFKWYDYMSWYPIGRPIGTTIYPGMQMTGVAIWEAMKRVPTFTVETPPVLYRSLLAMRRYGLAAPVLRKEIQYEPMSVNDICCMMPPWFGGLASLFLGLMTYEVTRSTNAAVMGVGIMAIIPAHLSRSMGGEFDNEAVAMTAICATFWCWLRSIRTPRSWPFGVLTGFLYIYMVAAWGGYIFVLNMIGVHALMLVGLGRFNSGVHKAYSLFFIIGTAGAVQVPVVGWAPLRSLEQLGPLLVFIGYQVLAFCDFQRRRMDLTGREFTKYRAAVCGYCAAMLLGAAVFLYPMGYFGPLSARIRGLFVKHTKTGNPLVDSVAEHQPASSGIYSAHLNLPLDYWLHGALICLFKRNNGAYFVALYGIVAAHFSGKMSRLVLICAPICSVSCAIWCGFLLDCMMAPIWMLLGRRGYKGSSLCSPATLEDADGAPEPNQPSGKQKPKQQAQTKQNAGKKKTRSSRTEKVQIPLDEWEEEERPGGISELKREVKSEFYRSFAEWGKPYEEARVFLDSSPMALLGRSLLGLVLLFYVLVLSGTPAQVTRFVQHCHEVARGLSSPKVVRWGRDSKGHIVKIDDYYAGYLWIDNNTPKDARVMAWWDYGYQITGIAKRTSIADGNTWNHEHIATLGRTLTSPEDKAWRAIRHLADYVLVWAGGRGDDLAKSPHLARIGNSVYPDHCGDDDPKCFKFGFERDGTPTKMMADSLLYKAVQHNLRPGVKLSSKYFKEVHTTKNGLMRVFKVMNVSQESKDWIADPANRLCDVPGSWYCPGQYPPALAKLIARRRNFAQVEDFNKGGNKSAYTRMIEEERAGRKREL